MLVVARPESGDLEHQPADPGAHGLAGRQERFPEQVCVEEVLVGLSGLLAEAVELGVDSIAQAGGEEIFSGGCR